ncbi:MAG: dihydropteroate synthase, partial [Proteobacteria bacterium]|nr:dihydropteroate synthase [Pseudomonadota bacterium]
ATQVTEEAELGRVLPVVTELVKNGCCVSIDTRHASVMAAAVGAGAKIINDVTALSGDLGSLRIAATSEAAIVLMHMLGEPGTMNEAPHYDDVVAEVYAYLEDRLSLCERAGIGRERIAVDPGIGFGKTARQNFTLLENLLEFKGLGCIILVGISRKFGGAGDPEDRLRRSLDGARDAVSKGANIVRVHDVAETVEVLSGLASSSEIKS